MCLLAYDQPSAFVQIRSIAFFHAEIQSTFSLKTIYHREFPRAIFGLTPLASIFAQWEL